MPDASQHEAVPAEDSDQSVQQPAEEKADAKKADVLPPEAASWEASAPANIALIKYMGKTAEGQPVNSSLSYTLPHLTTTVTLIRKDHGEDEWGAEEGDFVLNEAEQARFLAHLKRVKEHFKCEQAFKVRSKNSFPSHCGLASSAASFAALTRCVVAAVTELLPRADAHKLTRRQLSDLSRQGSGSSCRSFFDQWALWSPEDGVEAIALPYPELQHYAAVVSTQPKPVSSSEAHQRVQNSLLFTGRPERAERRLQSLIYHLHKQDWQGAFEVVWQEYWDMHALFETSQPNFGYMQAGTLSVLQLVRDCWAAKQDGPLVTLDAGANVHVLFRPDQEKLAKDLIKKIAKVAAVIGPDGRWLKEPKK